MLAAGFEAMSHRRRKADAITGKTILYAFLHLRIEVGDFLLPDGWKPTQQRKGAFVPAERSPDTNPTRRLAFRQKTRISALFETPGLLAGG
ncbi:hypothetical protein SAMN04244575_04340 [Sinorhizobium meliloti]|nr:hypothetical protein SAMN04244575_04340 [Sinorhizobium meliloti]